MDSWEHLFGANYFVYCCTWQAACRPRLRDRNSLKKLSFGFRASFQPDARTRALLGSGDSQSDACGSLDPYVDVEIACGMCVQGGMDTVPTLTKTERSKHVRWTRSILIHTRHINN